MDPIEAIKRLKASYFRHLDTKDWLAFEGLFTEDVTMIYDAAVSTNGADPKTSPPFHTRKVVVGFIRSMLENCITVHHGHMPEIDILSPTEAKGIWALEDILEYSDRIKSGYGYYHETYRFEENRWKIASIKVIRIRISTTAVGELNEPTIPTKVR